MPQSEQLPQPDSTLDVAPEGERPAEVQDVKVAEQEMNPLVELPKIESALANNHEQIEQMQAALEGERAKLAELRQSLGLPPNGDSPVATERQLADLVAERERLENEKKEAESVEDLNALLEELNKLPKAELTIIIETGKRSDGSELKGKDGKAINEDVAKQLGKLAEQGITKITAAILKGVFAIVKGALSGIYRGAKEAISGSASET